MQNSLKNLMALVRFAEKKIHRIYLTEQLFTETPFDQAPFDRKVTLPKTFI
jgi:hypothetical protein